MKVLLVIFAICAYTYSAHVFRHEHNEELNMENIIKKKCDSNSGGTQAFDRLREESDNILKCVEGLSSISIDDSLLHHEDFCRALRESNVYECVANFTDVILRPCLDETEAYLPDYLLSIRNNTYTELCGVNGESNLEYLLNIIDSQIPKVKMCSKITGNLLMSEETFSNLTIYRNLMDNHIINLNANDLCSDLTSIKKRFSILMKQECNADYSRFVDLQSQPFLEVCNNL